MIAPDNLFTLIPAGYLGGGLGRIFRDEAGASNRCTLHSVLQYSRIL